MSEPAVTSTVPVALTIAGSDPSGGAGIQADLKTFSALGAYGCAVLTAATAQSTRGVTGVHPIPPAFVAEQIATLVDDVRLDATKIGMLGSAETAAAVGAAIPTLGCPVVLDPVMVTTSGSRLLDDDAVDAVRDLLPLADLVTPNLPEAGVLLGHAEASTLDEQREQARAIRDLGAPRVLLKGGHHAGTEAIDAYADENGVRLLRAPRVGTRNTHGTGCTLSSAIAALLPRHEYDWPATIRAAKVWLTEALEAGDRLRIGRGPGPVHHFHRWW